MYVSLEQAVAKLQRGEVVAIPTETVYGLAGDARHAPALKQIYALKERPASNPLIVHIGQMAQVNDWVSEFPPLAKKLAEAFWPGPFTLVLPAKAEVSSVVRAGEPTVALRMPAHPVTQQVLKASGLALAAPSANKYTQLSPTTAAHVEQSLGQEVAVLDGGPCDVGIESTIVFVAGEQWQLLRLGMVTLAQIEAVAGCSASHCETVATPKVPGQHVLHYSPATPIQLFDHRADLIAFSKQQSNSAVMLFGEDAPVDVPSFVLPNVAQAAAEKLYETLHKMDALQVKALLIENPPNEADWLAIQDRLQRASHKLN